MCPVLQADSLSCEPPGEPRANELIYISAKTLSSYSEKQL